jgi:hypothetical protein
MQMYVNVNILLVGTSTCKTWNIKTEIYYWPTDRRFSGSLLYNIRLHISCSYFTFSLGFFHFLFHAEAANRKQQCILYEFISGTQYYNTNILFPIKEPFRAEQLTKKLIQWLWIDYIDCFCQVLVNGNLKKEALIDNCETSRLRRVQMWFWSRRPCLKCFIFILYAINDILLNTVKNNIVACLCNAFYMNLSLEHNNTIQIFYFQLRSPFVIAYKMKKI